MQKFRASLNDEKKNSEKEKARKGMEKTRESKNETEKEIDRDKARQGMEKIRENKNEDIESLGLFGDFRRRKTHLFGILRPLKH